MTNSELASDITKKILKNLRNRKGFRHLLESIELDDPETYDEIREDISTIIESSLNHNEN